MIKDFDELLSRIDELLDRKDNAIIAIDGCSASFKTTFGEILAKRYDSNIIHIDDFYNKRTENTPKHLKTSVEGNISYPYLKEKVIDNLKENSFSYRKFDCKTQTFLKEEVIYKNKLTIIEGTYSLNPKLGKYYDLSIFFDLNEDMQKERIMIRNKNNFEWFISTWVRLEKVYFKHFNIKESSDIVINTSFLNFWEVISIKSFY